MCLAVTWLCTVFKWSRMILSDSAVFQNDCHQKCQSRLTFYLEGLNTEESKSIQHSQVSQPSPVAVRDGRVHLSDNVVFMDTKSRDVILPAAEGHSDT